jgi:phage terminase large subunit-like protein
MGTVHHVGTFRDMEAELMTYCGYDADASPNRMDALVWACSDLMGIAQGSWSVEESIEEAFAQ